MGSIPCFQVTTFCKVYNGLVDDPLMLLKRSLYTAEGLLCDIKLERLICGWKRRRRKGKNTMEYLDIQIRRLTSVRVCKNLLQLPGLFIFRIINLPCPATLSVQMMMDHIRQWSLTASPTHISVCIWSLGPCVGDESFVRRGEETDRSKRFVVFLIISIYQVHLYLFRDLLISPFREWVDSSTGRHRARYVKKGNR